MLLNYGGDNANNDISGGDWGRDACIYIHDDRHPPRHLPSQSSGNYNIETQDPLQNIRAVQCVTPARRHIVFTSRSFRRHQLRRSPLHSAAGDHSARQCVAASQLHRAHAAGQPRRTLRCAVLLSLVQVNAEKIAFLTFAAALWKAGKITLGLRRNAVWPAHEPAEQVPFLNRRRAVVVFRIFGWGGGGGGLVWGEGCRISQIFLSGSFFTTKARSLSFSTKDCNQRRLREYVPPQVFSASKEKCGTARWHLMPSLPPTTRMARTVSRFLGLFLYAVEWQLDAATRWFECAACTFPAVLLDELNGLDEALDCGDNDGDGDAFSAYF
jgi:hypothetical protein